MMKNDEPTTRAEARDARALRYDPEMPALSYELASEPQILPLWMRRTFYVAGTLAGAAALIVGGYDAELAKNIAGAGVLIVSSLALANPPR